MTAPTPARAVHLWPGALPARGDGVLAIGIATPIGAPRELVRKQIRLALRQALARWIELALDEIELISKLGLAPHIALGNGIEIACSISHEAGLSLAAIHLHGAIGVDLMQVQEVPDWHSVARDYLGPACAAALAATAPEQRAHAFAKAWTAHEASLKCQGLALTEWMPGPQPSPPLWSSVALALPLPLPQGLVGTLVVTHQPNWSPVSS